MAASIPPPSSTVRPHPRPVGTNARLLQKAAAVAILRAPFLVLSLAHGFASDGASLRSWLRAVLDELVREWGGEDTRMLLMMLLAVLAIAGVYTLYRDDA